MNERDLEHNRRIRQLMRDNPDARIVYRLPPGFPQWPDVIGTSPDLDRLNEAIGQIVELHARQNVDCPCGCRGQLAEHLRRLHPPAG